MITTNKYGLLITLFRSVDILSLWFAGVMVGSIKVRILGRYKVTELTKGGWGDGENKQIMAQTFCHELLHALFFSTGRVEDHNEVLIDGLAHSLHQFLVEMYED